MLASWLLLCHFFSIMHTERLSRSMYIYEEASLCAEGMHREVQVVCSSFYLTSRPPLDQKMPISKALRWTSPLMLVTTGDS